MTDGRHRTRSTKGPHSIVASCADCSDSLESWGHDESSRSAIAAWMKAHEAEPPPDYAVRIAERIAATAGIADPFNNPEVDRIAAGVREGYALGFAAAL